MFAVIEFLFQNRSCTVYFGFLSSLLLSLHFPSHSHTEHKADRQMQMLLFLLVLIVCRSCSFGVSAYVIKTTFLSLLLFTLRALNFQLLVSVSASPFLAPTTLFHFSFSGIITALQHSPLHEHAVDISLPPSFFLCVFFGLVLINNSQKETGKFQCNLQLLNPSYCFAGC